MVTAALVGLVRELGSMDAFLREAGRLDQWMLFLCERGEIRSMYTVFT